MLPSRARSRRKSATALVGELTVLVPMAGLIDAAAEAERLGKLLAKTQQDLAKTQQKLANENFVRNAPPEVVEQERERIADLERTVHQPHGATRAPAGLMRSHECAPALDADSRGDCSARSDALETIILGKPQQVRLCLACLLARGHLLIEDVPGVGKTTLAHALAHVLGLAWQRVQFTSDLLPADIIGVSVFDRASQQFHFRQGPIFTQLLLADEVNRASPRTQSALLEAMEERQVSADVTTYRAARAVLRRRHAESARAARHLRAARIAARPVPHARHARLSRTRRTSASCCAAASGATCCRRSPPP